MKFANRVRMTVSGNPGTGTVTLKIAVAVNWKAFGDVYETGDRVRYEIIEDGVGWEVGIGTWASGTLGGTLSRDRVSDNSLGTTAKLSFTKRAFVENVAAAEEYQKIADSFVSIAEYQDSDPVDLDDIAAGDNHTAAVNSAWEESGGSDDDDDPDRTDGLPVLLPGGPDKVYTFVASELLSKRIKVIGRASWRISEDGPFTNPHPTLDDDGLSDDSYTVSGSIDQIYRCSETPQFLYAMPNSSGARGINKIYGGAAPDFDTRYSTWTHIAGNEKTAASLLYSNRLTIVGDNNMPLVQRVQHATLVGSHILDLARCEFHRAVVIGSGAMGQALAVKTRHEVGIDDGIGYSHEYQNKTWWVNNADVATKQWQRDVAISANSGLRHNYEAAASAWVTPHSYTKGDWAEQGGRNYWCLISHTSSVFATDLADELWEDEGPVVLTDYGGGDENDVLNIVTLGDVGAGRKLNTFDDSRFFIAIGRDSMNHAFKVTNSNAIGYRILATPKEIDGVDGMGNYAFQRSFGAISDFAFIGGHTGEHTQKALSGFSGGPYNFQWATSIYGIAAAGYQVGRYAGCGPAVGVSDSSWTDWASGATYTGGIEGAGSYVIVSGQVYRCVTTHTAGVWATDLAAAKWVAVDDYEPTAIYLESDYDHATRGRVQKSVVTGHFAAFNTGRILRSFLSGTQVMDQAYGAVDDIVIGSFGLRYSRSIVGKRIIFGGNSYPYLGYGDIFSVYSDTLSRGVLTFNTATGGFILNANPSANMATATSADRITEAGHIYNKAGNTKLVDFLDDGGVTIYGSASAFDALRLQSTHTNATGGPFLILDRFSASPAAADNIGGIRFYGRDSGAAETEFARIMGSIVDPTDGTEDGSIVLQTVIAGGALATRMSVGAGVYTAGATGGDKGVDTYNGAAYYAMGAKVVGIQKTGWGVPTSTLSRAVLADYAAQTISAVPTQVQVQNIDDRLEILNNTLAGVINDFHSGGASTTHGLFTT